MGHGVPLESKLVYEILQFLEKYYELSNCLKVGHDGHEVLNVFGNGWAGWGEFHEVFLCPKMDRGLQ